MAQQTYPKLISFKLCPFVQKSIIALQRKHIEYDIEYIDLTAPPDWFLKISPLGKVPVLVIEDHVIFESSVINEFLEDAYPEKLHPTDLIQRAKNRSWIEFSSNCLVDSYSLGEAKSKQDFDKTLTELNGKLDQLEQTLENEPYFNGDSYSLVDASFAPLFHRLSCLQALNPVIFDLERHPKINCWKKQLLLENAFLHSTASNFTELYHKLLWSHHGHISTFLKAAQFPAQERANH